MTSYFIHPCIVEDPRLTTAGKAKKQSLINHSGLIYHICGHKYCFLKLKISILIGGIRKRKSDDLRSRVLEFSECPFCPPGGLKVGHQTFFQCIVNGKNVLDHISNESQRVLSWSIVHVQQPKRHFLSKIQKSQPVANAEIARASLRLCH